LIPVEEDDLAMGRTVLVVDDDASVFEVIAGMLEDRGCEVISAQSGRETLDQLRRNKRISILITDINMPGMDRDELAERATHLSPELKVQQLSGRERRRAHMKAIRASIVDSRSASCGLSGPAALQPYVRAGRRFRLAISTARYPFSAGGDVIGDVPGLQGAGLAGRTTPVNPEVFLIKAAMAKVF